MRGPMQNNRLRASMVKGLMGRVTNRKPGRTGSLAMRFLSGLYTGRHKQ